MHSFTKKAMISALMAIIIVFTGCSEFLPRTLLLNASNDYEIAEDRFNEIIQALGDRDCEALEKMFSEEAKEKSLELSENIEALVEYFKGDIAAYEHELAGTYESTANGETVTEISCSAVIDTYIDDDVKKYYLFFVEKISSKDNEEGLYHLDLKDSYSRYYPSDETAGAVIPNMFTAENYLNGILSSFSGDMGNMVLELFAKDVKNEIDLNDAAYEILEYVDGRIDSYNELKAATETEGDFIVTKGYYELIQGMQAEKTYHIYFVHKLSESDPYATGMYTLKIAEKTSENMELDISNDELGIIIEQTALE